jgi:sulfoxide reductase heme-binding subunit YedZ
MTFPKLNLWWLIFLGCLLPLVWLLFDMGFGNLGGNPIQALHIRLGDWSLRFLCITLAITPVQTMTHWRGMTDFRQLFGMYTFFYASLHVLAYLTVDNALVWPIIGMDIVQSSYIWFGILAYVLIFLLGISTPKAAKKRLGKSWKKLHRFIYLAALAAIVHYFWQLKGNLAQPVLYLLLIGFLLFFRIIVWLKDRQLGRMFIPKSNK